MSISNRIKECIDNHDEYVAILATLPDKELAKKLDLVHIQSEIAERTQNTGSLELLEIWHQQIIEARIYKAENEIPDAPNEIEIAIAEIETIVVRTEERHEVLSDFNVSVKQPLKKSPKHEESDSQLSLF